jgi:hypothetical protein
VAAATAKRATTDPSIRDGLKNKIKVKSKTANASTTNSDYGFSLEDLPKQGNLPNLSQLMTGSEPSYN